MAGRKPPCLTLWILGAALLLLSREAAWPQLAPLRLLPAARVAAAPRPDAGTAADDPADEYRGAADPLLDSATEGLLRRARRHIEAEEWNEVVDLYDEILASLADPDGRLIEPTRRRKTSRDGPGEERKDAPPAATFTIGDAVVSVDGIRYRPIGAAVRGEMLALPSEAQALYRRTHEAAARHLLEEARSAGGQAELEMLRRLAVRYPLTEAGGTAWHILGLRYLDARRFGLAASALQARLDLPFGPADPPRGEVLAQAAMAHLLSGARGRGLERLKQIETEASETTILVRGEAVGGHEVSLHPFFKKFAEAGSATGDGVEASSVWPEARGSFDHSAVALSEETRPELGSHARWIFPPGASRPVGSRRPTGRPHAAGTVAWHGLIFVRGDLLGGDLVALNARTGKIEWRASPRELGELTRATQTYGLVGDLGLTLHTLAAGTIEGRVDGPGGDSPDRALVIGIDRQSPASRRSNGSYRYAANRLVAYDARSGKLAWSLHGGDLQSVGVSSVTFTVPPVSCSTSGPATTLVTTAINQESVFLVGLSASGEARWCRRLYDHDFSSYRTVSASYGASQTLAARDNLVLAAPGHGVCAAVDSRTGDVVWVSRYRSRIRTRTATPRWIRPAPMVTPHLAVVTPADSDYATAFDLESGVIAWERRFPHEPHHVLGADDSSLYLCSDRLHALNLDDGRDRWMGEPFEESLGRVYGEGFLATDFLMLPFSSGAVGVFSTADGERTSVIKLQDRLLTPTTYKRLFTVADTLYAATGEMVFAIEPQEESWTRMSRARRQDLLKKALLFRAERRFDEALAIYYDLHERYRSKSLDAQVEKEALATAREAAKATGDPAVLTQYLGRRDSMLADPSVRRSLELLEAKLLLDADEPASKQGAVERFLHLCELEGVLATSPDDLEVDVATYASDVLRDLRQAGEPALEEVDARDSSSARLASRLAAGAELEPPSLSRIALRSSHLQASALALARLVAMTEADVGAAQARALFDLLLEDFPALGQTPSVLTRRAALAARAGRESRDSSLRELPPVLASDRPLEKRYWIAADEGFLAASVPRATPAPALFAVCGSEVRAYDEEGAVALRLDLPDYPDVSDVKQYLRSQYEEPAAMYFGDGRLVLFTPAGLYGFSYRSPALTTSAEESRDNGRRSLERIKTLRLRWAQPHPHPLLRYNPRSGIGWGGLQLPQAQNFFAECGLLDEDPLVLLPGGELYQIRKNSGKLLWRMTLSATPTSGPETHGSWISVRTSGPTGLRSVQLPAPDGALGRKRFVEGPEKANYQAVAVLGQLVTVFSGGDFAVIESLTGQPLWRKKGYLGRVVFTSGDSLWISEAEGKLRARSVRSGRVRKTVELPAGATVVDVREDPGDPGTDSGAGTPRAASRTLVAIGSPGSSTVPRGVINKVPTGSDLYVIRLNAAGDKVWESQVHSGAVVYGGSWFRAADGRFILAFNAEGTGDKWYTKLVRVDPRKTPPDSPERKGPDGDDESRNEALVEIASIEISGKGTMLPPRLSLLEGALALGNTDGFGWLEPGRSLSGTESEETKNGTEVEPGSRGTARSSRADRE